MLSFSIFEFHSFQNIEEFGQRIQRGAEVRRSVRGWTEDLISEVRVVNGFSLEEFERVQIENQTLQYLFFQGYTERKKNEAEWYNADGTLKSKDLRINSTIIDILVVEMNNCLYGIVFAGINRAKAIVKDIFTVECWGHVTPLEFNISEDLLYWIFKRFIDTPREPLSEGQQVYITALESYMGKTRDRVNAMRGEGSRISTILGTLTFLFNNEELKAIRPAIQYGFERVLLEIGLTGTFKTWPQEYRGHAFMQLTGTRKNNAIAIYIFNTIIPLLISCYEENCERDHWSPQLKIDFVQRLGNIIRTKVEEVLRRIEQENGQLASGIEEYDDLDDLDDLEIEDEDEL
ncbi:hypothetical protein KHU1_0999 [Bacillus amyloliquefaciens KHG19]|uniref:hypothetical protein n=1 Tax=Bacillus amyloliquefaciens group TaxID=1938374 RepID=UPI0005AD4B01|nr:MULTISPECIES: hypothetical protein [Bacillus amyloliquefaciens group]AJK64966.1 hypothetical protein KHU1_0999 [Bacillus amyloliquefaciens KHG19]UMQ51426.1 hypothetical protein MKF36_06170 [Bacillus velezensis]